MTNHDRVCDNLMGWLELTWKVNVTNYRETYHRRDVKNKCKYWESLQCISWSWHGKVCKKRVFVAWQGPWPATSDWVVRGNKCSVDRFAQIHNSGADRSRASLPLRKLTVVCRLVPDRQGAGKGNLKSVHRINPQSVEQSGNRLHFQKFENILNCKLL